MRSFKRWHPQPIARALHTITELCEVYDVAWETGYYRLRRHQQAGLEALQDRDRTTRQLPNQSPEEIEKAVLELRPAYISWDPQKLKRVLEH